jgi:hypothetical protein
VKSGREIVEILEVYDLAGSYRAAAELAGCDHHAVARYVKLRAEGRSPEERAQRSRPIDDFMDKIEELVARGCGTTSGTEKSLSACFTASSRQGRRSSGPDTWKWNRFICSRAAARRKIDSAQ